MINKAYKCRLYPNKEQEAYINNNFGACRWLWNECLATKKAFWENEKRNISRFELDKMTTKLKSVYPWLAEVDSRALKYTLRDLDQAYQNFFRRVKRGEKPGYPKFKRRSDRNQSYKTNGAIHVIDEHHVKLPKMGVVKVRGLQKVEGRIVNATIRRVPSGKYFLSLCCTDVPEPEMPAGENDILGIDAGVKDLMIRSDGTKVPNDRYAYKAEKKLRREQRRLARKKKGSANYEKQRVKVARAYEKVANQRSNAIHNATTQAVRDAKAIAVEDLNVKGMVKNHHLARAVSDASMSEMTRQLQYKCGWYGRDFVKIDRWFPSSKTCGNCGEVFEDLTLGMREWTCPSCGAHHDRDVNAAKNIAREGQRMLDAQGV